MDTIDDIAAVHQTLTAAKLAPGAKLDPENIPMEVNPDVLLVIGKTGQQLHVPADPLNRHYQMVELWLQEDGNTIQPPLPDEEPEAA